MDLNTPVWRLTVGELCDIISQQQKPEEPKVEDYTGDRYVHGYKGIASLLGCSETMVYMYRKQGWIEPAIRQNGRKIICDKMLALELFGKNK